MEEILNYVDVDVYFEKEEDKLHTEGFVCSFPIWHFYFILFSKQFDRIPILNFFGGEQAPILFRIETLVKEIDQFNSNTGLIGISSSHFPLKFVLRAYTFFHI